MPCFKTHLHDLIIYSSYYSTYYSSYYSYLLFTSYIIYYIMILYLLLFDSQVTHKIWCQKQKRHVPHRFDLRRWSVCNWSVHSKKQASSYWWCTGWWFGTCFMFHNIWNNHPNWLSYFSEGRYTTNQCIYIHINIDILSWGII